MIDGFKQADLDWRVLRDVVFVMSQYLARAFDYRHGKGSQARYFDAIALVGCSGLYFSQEQNLVFRFLDGDVQISYAREGLGQLG